MYSTCVIKAGENLSLKLEISDGSASDISSVNAVLKRALGGGWVPSSEAPYVATFFVEGMFDGWFLKLDSSQTQLLTPGLYIMDAAVTLVTNEVIITDPLRIEVRASVSG